MKTICVRFSGSYASVLLNKANKMFVQIRSNTNFSVNNRLIVNVLLRLETHKGNENDFTVRSESLQLVMDSSRLHA